jgi:hypothetical protein
MLLRDCLIICNSLQGERIRSKDLLEGLNKLEESPWAEMNNRHGINYQQVNQLLDAFEIQSKDMRIDGGKPVKGFEKKWFVEAGKAYPLPGGPSPQQ